MALVLDWQNAGQPDDLILQISRRLRQGGTVALPTEAGYVFVAAASMIAGSGGIDIAIRSRTPCPLRFRSRILSKSVLSFRARNVWLGDVGPGPLTLTHSEHRHNPLGFSVPPESSRRLICKWEMN